MNLKQSKRNVKSYDGRMMKMNQIQPKNKTKGTYNQIRSRIQKTKWKNFDFKKKYIDILTF